MTALVVLDIFLRRLALPLVLIASVILRFNVISLVYLLLLIVSLLLPGPRLKTQKASSLVYLSLVLIWSLLAVLCQALFQIVQATDYSDQLQPCNQKENILRQFGFVRYNEEGIRSVDIVRYLLPDCVVLIVAIATFVTCACVLAQLRKKNSDVEEHVDPSLQEETKETDLECPETKSEKPSETTSTTPHYPSHVQCYWHLPKLVLQLFDASIFITLGLSGVAVPSLTSFAYYVVFLIILIIWGCHQTVRLRGVVRIMRCGMTFYTMVHLIILYLYQFQAAQQNIPLQPNDTVKSLLARLFGLTSIIRTDCEYPTHLLLHSDIEYPVLLNPALLLLLCLLLTTDLRLWINTPDILWNEHVVYFLPISDAQPSSNVVRLISSGRSSSPVQWTRYGTSPIKGFTEQAVTVAGASGNDSGSSEYRAYREKEPEGRDEDNIDDIEAIPKSKKRRITWTNIKERIVQTFKNIGNYLFLTSFIPAIICMMLWSVLYPSWPALLLLLWACVIWLIPKFTPKDSLYYTSPLLIVYAVCLLILQYIFSLDLTQSELAPLDGLGQECDNNTTRGCKSFVPLVKTAFTLVFFCAFHEFIRQMLEKHRPNHDTTDEGVSDDTEANTGLQKWGSILLTQYWVVVVIAAFLLVSLSGEPNIFKLVYLIFFFVFLITYQVFRSWWYYLCVPVWWGLVVYAALELSLIYTYQFDSVSDAWERAYNNTPHLTVNSEDLFNSIGLKKSGINSLRSLLISLIPPAVFIAVMAMQLRYFSPRRNASESSRIDLSSLLPANLRSSLPQSSVTSRDSPDVDQSPAIHHEDTDGGAHPRSASRSSSVASSVAPGKSLYYIYQVISYLLLKTKQILLGVIQLSWRFLELHLDKIVMIVLFTVVLSEVSAGYWVVLMLSVITIPFPYFSPILYPIITVYIGLISVLKTIYQFPMVNFDMFNLTTINKTENDTQCYDLNITSYLDNYTGVVFDYRYSSRGSDAGWLGLHKVSNYAQYIVGLLCVALLMSLRFSVKRHQTEYYHLKKIVIQPWEKGSLFLKVSRQKAEKSVVAALKYFINHVYEIYGIEITFIMVAIAVAVRIDAYGMFYCLVLGVMLVLPRGLMVPMWLLYTTVHGLLLILQYSMLLGVPPGLCFSPIGDKKYPWQDIGHSAVTGFSLKKWLFLSDYPQLLDRNVLYVDYLVYMLLCMQLYNFKQENHFSEPLSNYFHTDSLINNIKIFVMKYYFWVSIFLVFFTAISRVSFFGFFYLLLCFLLLYRGQNMLTDRRSRRTKSWAMLRLLAWAILFVRISVQIADCVFYDDLSRDTQCNLILVFNGGCNRERFYGSPSPKCSDYPHNVGLWVDALTFAVVTIQIIIFDTQYSEMMRAYLIERAKKAGYFSDVFEQKMEERQQKAKEGKDKEFIELNKRVQLLSSSEKTIDHILHAGVRVPEDIHLGVRTKPKSPSIESSSELVVSLELSGAIAAEQPKKKPSSATDIIGEETSKLKKFWTYVSNAVTEFVDKCVEWLEKSNSVYVEVVDELKQQVRNKEMEDAMGELESLSQSIEQGTVGISYGSVQGEQVDVEVTEVEDRSDTAPSTFKPDASLDQAPPAQLLQFPETGASLPSTKTVRFAKDNDSIYPDATEDDGHVADFEKEFGEVAVKYSKRPVRVLRALQNTLVAHAEYVIYFLVILNVILNGSILSLGYVCLLFGWGLFCIPWPSKTFWLVMIFYSMLVLILKYSFQFHDINYHDEGIQDQTGFSTPNILGIQYYKNSADFFRNSAWDMLLLISLLINRGLLKQNGLWRENNKIQGTIFFRVKNGVKVFYSRLLNPDISQGASDYYVIMLIFDVLCLITIVFGVSSFGIGIAGGGLSQAASYIQNNYVPFPFVIMLLLQFLSMLVDRAIYLRHALKTKFVFQMFLLVVWHLWLLFVLPSENITRTPFTMNVAAQCIYFFKCLYFVVSAMQIVSGYPTQILGYYLGRQYTTVSGLLFSGYRTIPLLPELREVMDWVFTDTALPLLHWLRVQEIYAKLYLVKVRRHREKGSPRDLGDKQSLLIKALLGGVMLVVLVLLIWGPLLVISFINSTSVSNKPVSVSIGLSLDGYEPLVQINVQHDSLMSLNDSEYDYFKNSFQSQVQPRFGNQLFQSDFTKAVFPYESTSLWTISPPAKSLLLNSLNNVKKDVSTSINLQFSWSVERAPVSSASSEVVSGLTTRSLTYAQNPSTLDDLISALDGNSTNVSLTNLYPRVIYAPDTGQSDNYTDLSRFFITTTNIKCNTSLSSSNTSNEEWWTLAECTNPIFTDIYGPPILLIYSDRIASQIFSLIAGFGIIGLYVSVVLVIGRLIRGAISSLPSELLLDEIVNPDQLLKLCNDIFTVRESGDFRIEEILVGKLFAIFRSPEILIEMTEDRKEKKD